MKILKLCALYRNQTVLLSVNGSQKALPKKSFGHSNDLREKKKRERERDL